MAYCQHCGKEIEEHLISCEHCSVLLQEDKIEDDYIKWGILIGLFSFIGGLAMFLVWRPTKPNSALAALLAGIANIVILYALYFIFIGKMVALFIENMGLY